MSGQVRYWIAFTLQEDVAEELRSLACTSQSWRQASFLGANAPAIVHSLPHLRHQTQQVRPALVPAAAVTIVRTSCHQPSHPPPLRRLRGVPALLWRRLFLGWGVAAWPWWERRRQGGRQQLWNEWYPLLWIGERKEGELLVCT